jgi:SAM-dependent methyltransferase
VRDGVRTISFHPHSGGPGSPTDSSEQGLYNGTATFSQGRPVGHGLYEMMSHIAILDLYPAEKFIFDTASGPILHPEYLACSSHHQVRVCVDMSLVALMDAHQKLAERGFCCLADICCLLRNEAFDGAISGYTIQHIPRSNQQLAVQELHRVIRPGAHLCILTTVEASAARRGLFFLVKVPRRLLALLGLAHKTPIASSRPQASGQPERLYCYLQKLAWWKKVAAELTGRYSLETLRI